jgi:hypothetical protein
MSVVLITPDHYGSLRKTIRHLHAQTVKNCLELIIVAPLSDNLNLDEAELQDFCQFRVAEVGPIPPAAGILWRTPVWSRTRTIRTLVDLSAASLYRRHATYPNRASVAHLAGDSPLRSRARAFP